MLDSWMDITSKHCRPGSACECPRDLDLDPKMMAPVGGVLNLEQYLEEGRSIGPHPELARLRRRDTHGHHRRHRLDWYRHRQAFVQCLPHASPGQASKEELSQHS